MATNEPAAPEEPNDEVERAHGTGAKGDINDPEAKQTDEDKAELDGTKGYDLNVQLPMANPFAPWKTDAFNLVPACN